MDIDKFDSIIEEQIEICRDILVLKAKEYATEDRLHNFRVAAQLQNISKEAALAGFMAKHTVSIYDMCHSDKVFQKAQWSEKITDHINYLLLLKAIVNEE